MGLRLSGGSKRGETGPPSRPTRKLVAVGLVLAFVSSVPAPAAALSADDVDFLERAREGCPEGWWGVGGSGANGNRVCVFAEADLPETDRILDLLSGDIDRDPCPQGFAGTIVHRGDATVGVCFRVVYDVPENPWPVVGWDLSACEIPDERGEDPVIFVADGGVGFCVVPIVDVGDAGPDVFVSTEPCEPRTTDPEVRVFGGGARVCLDVSLFGLGNEQLNLVVSVAEDLLDEIPGYVPTP